MTLFNVGISNSANFQKTPENIQTGENEDIFFLPFNLRNFGKNKLLLLKILQTCVIPFENSKVKIQEMGGFTVQFRSFT